MDGYIFSPEADEDLADIIRYTRETWGERQLNRYLTLLENGIAELIAGRIIFMPFPGYLRMAYVGHHEIIVRMMKESCPVVEAIFHEKMDLFEQMKKRCFK